MRLLSRPSTELSRGGFADRVLAASTAPLRVVPQVGRASGLSRFRNSAGPLAREATYLTTFRPAEMPVHPSGLRTSVLVITHHRLDCVPGSRMLLRATAAAAGMTTDQLERRTVAIRGRTEPIEVIILPRPDRNVSPMSTIPEGSRTTS